ncbi:hypothetical protein CXZ10_20390 [Pleomorphomonas diazotrophica]|uniref:Uncharacterized protein n=1 Tax=Pleomorphomonas diazotrophica TaxID=1166257 RepID=A0A1I4V6B4_9HYPH|nr:hypothetical protein [Pleomorphomonas diazotrophica]PKR87406.1 hypothetical protein CXZ10_20390 [Pleomorphomonas diazotrophica]SFM96701.1 hypothetical protein SAMN05192571_110105 [Pleomorphomonas diazotrophica]
MPVVPTYEDRGIRLDPGLNFRDNTHATGEMFGSQVGAALGSVGRGLADLGQAVAEVHELDATNAAKDSHNGLIERVRELGYGDGGYLGTSGRSAVEGYAGYEAAVRQAVKDGARGLSPLALAKYMDAANATAQGALATGEAHALDGRKAWTTATSEARMAAFHGNAVAQSDNPHAVAENTLAALTEYREIGKLMGWPEGEVTDRGMGLVSGVYEDIARNKAATDPIGAMAFIRDNAPLFTEAARKRLDAEVGEAARDEETRQGALAFAAGRRKPAEASQPPVEGVAGADAAGRVGPTLERALLLGRMTGDDAGKVLRLDPNFSTNLSALLEDAPSAFRDDINIRIPESEADGKGRSGELTYRGKSLSIAPSQLLDWARRNAGRYGLVMPVGGSGSSVMAAADGVAARALRPSSDAIDKHLAGIADPDRREIAKQAIVTSLDLESQQEQERRAAAKAELWQRVDGGAAPDALPFTLRQAAGSGAMTVARNYVSKALAGPIIGDDVLLADMRLFSAERPEDFAQVDLNDYRDRLGKSDLKALAESQSAIGQDSRKARDEGAELKDAFDMARTRLVNAGALPPSGEESAEQRHLLARVQNAVYTGLADFRAANPNARPTPSDIYKSVDPFLMPYYLPQRDPRPKPKVKLSDISPDLRTSITRQLAMELGRKPTDGEVAREYAAFRQSQVG